MHTIFIACMTGAIFVELSQLIFMKIIKIVATRCQILRLKCIKFNLGWGPGPRPCWGALYSAPPDLLAGFKGPTSKGEGENGVDGREGSPLLYSADLRP